MYTTGGKLAGAAFLSFVLKMMGRTSLASQLWVIAPGDPRQARAELLDFITGLYLAAIAATRERLDRDDVSVLDVHKTMLDRAKAQPIVALFVIYMRLIEVATMILGSRRVGSAGDFDSYRSARALALPFYACANCHDYIFITLTGTEDWATASDALRKIMAEIVFTKLSSSGNALYFSDDWLENIVQDGRTFLGKHYKSGSDAHVIRTFRDIAEKIARRRGVATPPRGDVTAPSTARKLAAVPIRSTPASSRAVAVGIALAEDHNFWRPGPTNYRKASKYVVSEPGSFVAPDGGALLNAELLVVLSSGHDRLLRAIDERRGSYGADKPLAKINNLQSRFPLASTYAADVAKRRDWEARQPTEMRAAELSKTFDGVIGKGDQFITCALITLELQEWRAVQAAREGTRLGPELPGPAFLKKLLKPALVELLSLTRRAMFDAGVPPCPHSVQRHHFFQNPEEEFGRDGPGGGRRSVVPGLKTPEFAISVRQDGTFAVNGTVPAENPMIALTALASQDARISPRKPLPPPPPPPPLEDIFTMAARLGVLNK